MPSACCHMRRRILHHGAMGFTILLSICNCATTSLQTARLCSLCWQHGLGYEGGGFEFLYLIWADVVVFDLWARVEFGGRSTAYVLEWGRYANFRKWQSDTKRRFIITLHLRKWLFNFPPTYMELTKNQSSCKYWLKNNVVQTTGYYWV